MANWELGYRLYNLGWLLATFLFLPYFIGRNLIEWRPIWPYVKGLDQKTRSRLTGQPVIWVQAVSVGETVVANAIINEIASLLPGYQLVFTTTTPTGQAIAKQLLGETALVTYFPWDRPRVMQRFINQIRPWLFIMVETELWPNAIRYSRAAGARVVVVNGRISDRSFRRYQWFAPFLQQVLGQVDLLAMQSVEDARRIQALGAVAGRVVVCGNAKFDQDYPVFDSETLTAFRHQYGWEASIPILAAASTHPGEDKIIIEAYRQLTAQRPYRLILAPRHPKRASEIELLLKKAGLSFARRSAEGAAPDPAVLLLDTFGELGLVYAVADSIFIGGSLVKVGGHNILEAAAQAKPVLYGPHMHNFRESRRLLEQVGAGFTVHNATELTATVIRLAADPVAYARQGDRAREAVWANRGAAQQTARLIAALVEKTT